MQHLFLRISVGFCTGALIDRPCTITLTPGQPAQRDKTLRGVASGIKMWYTVETMRVKNHSANRKGFYYGTRKGHIRHNGHIRRRGRRIPRSGSCGFLGWCGPCKMIAPVIEEISSEMEGKAKIVKVDIDQSQSLSERYEIMGVPTLLYFKGGELKDQIVGVVPKNVMAGKLEGLL
jgi:thioredoxin 1